MIDETVNSQAYSLEQLQAALQLLRDEKTGVIEVSPRGRLKQLGLRARNHQAPTRFVGGDDDEDEYSFVVFSTFFPPFFKNMFHVDRSAARSTHGAFAFHRNLLMGLSYPSHRAFSPRVLCTDLASQSFIFHSR